MNYTLMVVQGPDAGRAPFRALRFARALVQSGHRLNRVFFFGPGVRIGLNWEGAQLADWQELACGTSAELILCSASAERWGIDTAPSGFTIAGLGALMESGMDSDRVLTFA